MSVITLPEGINKVLALAGISASNDEEVSSTLSQELDEAGLDKKFLLNEIALIARSSDSDSTRMRAIEAGLKMHGLLTNKDEGSGTSKVTLVLYAPQVRSIKEFQTVEVTSQSL